MKQNWVSFFHCISSNFASGKDSEMPNSGAYNPIKVIEINFAIMYFMSPGHTLVLELKLANYKQYIKILNQKPTNQLTTKHSKETFHLPKFLIKY